MRRLALLLLSACVGDIPNPAEPRADVMGIGETREVELRYLRFDVNNYGKTFTKQDVLDLPQNVRDRLWLLDLDVTQLLDNSLATIAALDPAALSPAARNLQGLLRMTPDTANLAGTRFAPTLDLAPLFGISSARVLADLLDIRIDQPFLDSRAVSQAILRDIIRTHPNAQTRLGPKTRDNPLGIYPVAPGRLPVTLADAASDFATLSRRFGAYDKDGIVHPGFIVGETRSKILEDDFAMTVKVNANALPFKGVDMGTAARASINPIPSQIARIFDFDDPDWLRMTGITPGSPVIERLTFRIVEAPDFVRGGDSPIPTSYGNSDAWLLPAYDFEALLVDTVREAFKDRSVTLSYAKEGDPQALVSTVVDHGWLTIAVAGDVGQPPPPSYIWDVLLECAQVRLHDGGIAEGEADIEVPLTNIPVGVDTELIQKTIADNLRADPSALVEVASRIIDSTDGEADFYYVRQGDADWLYFVRPEDMGQKEDGSPRRPFAYTLPTFFGDATLTHDLGERVPIMIGSTLFAKDDAGAVFRIEVTGKPSLQRVTLGVTRLE